MGGFHLYSFIRGTIDSKQKDSIILENQGIGYLVYAPVTTIETVGSSGQPICLYTHLHVREDAMQLFGFSTPEERKIFELLLSVSGVGPKVALSIMSTISPAQFSIAVISEDSKALAKAQGIGIKLAQRIILELKDKLKKEQSSSLQSLIAEQNHPLLLGSNEISEAVSALLILGYSQQEAGFAVSKINTEGLSIEEIIKQSLRVISKHT